MSSNKNDHDSDHFEFKPPEQTVEQKAKALGKRMSEIINHVAAQKSLEKKSIEISLCDSVGLPGNNRFSRWYTGQGTKKLAETAVMLQTLEDIRGEPIDLRYFFYGKEPEQKDKYDQIIDRLDRNYSAVRYFSDYFRDHELGLEGIIMRHGVRMVQEIRGARRPLDPDGNHATSNEPFLAGFLHDWHSEVLESCSSKTRLALLGLEYGIELRHELQKGKDAILPGRFFDVVAENLINDRRYEYLFHGTVDEWTPIVRKFIAVLETHGHVPMAKLNKNIKFYVTDLPLGAGFVLLDIDQERLAEKSMFLLKELQRDYFTDQGLVGTLSTASVKTHGSALMDPDRAVSADHAWKQYMRAATEIR